MGPASRFFKSLVVSRPTVPCGVPRVRTAPHVPLVRRDHWYADLMCVLHPTYCDGCAFTG